MIDVSGYENVVVFDGECNLCSRSVQFLIRRDKRRVFRFASAQSRAGGEILRKYGLESTALDSVALIRGDRAYRRSDALLEIARQLGGAWRWLSVFAWVPRPVRDWVYKAIARNRHRWFRGPASCLMPTEDVKARFLDF